MRRRRKWKLLLLLIALLGIWAFIGLRDRLWPVAEPNLVWESIASLQVT